MTQYPQSSAHDQNACTEYNDLSRRRFLAASGAVGTSAIAFSTLAPAWLPRVAVAESYRSTQRDVLVSIYLRGGSDGLTMCVPHGDANYYAARPSINIPQPGSGAAGAAIDLDGFFGLPQAMSALVPAYTDDNLLIVHASGSTDPTRSHFDAQHFMEIGKPGDHQLFSGWLGRHLATVTPMSPTANLRGVGIMTGLARQLVGGPSTLPIPNLDTFDLQGSGTTKAARAAAISNMYEQYADPLRGTALNTFNTINLLNTINFSGYVPAGGATYPNNSFGTAMKSTAALIKAQVGVEAIAIDIGGWDTHANMGPINGGLATLMTTLAGAMGAFYTDLTTGVNPSFTVVAMSEFGRRVAENGSGGNDHGHGNAMFVMGPCINGGRVHATWPGLGPGNLYQNLDLQVTTDYRSVLAEIVQQRLGNNNLAAVFPGFTPVPIQAVNC